MLLTPMSARKPVNIVADALHIRPLKRLSSKDPTKLSSAGDFEAKRAEREPKFIALGWGGLKEFRLVRKGEAWRGSKERGDNEFVGEGFVIFRRSFSSMLVCETDNNSRLSRLMGI